VTAPDGITIRPARPSDAEVVAAYHHRCWLEAFAPLVGPGAVQQLDPSFRLPTFRHWFGDGSDEVTTLVADRDGVAVGHASVAGNEVVHLFVDPDHWGSGLGSRLLLEAEALITLAGHRHAELHTIVGNEPAIRLYRSHGWEVTDRILHQHVGPVSYDEHVLVKALRPA
jgi:GNAT superfamily N-acetyltransferase